MTLWFYEPVALVLAVLGMAVWCARRERSDEADQRRRDLLVVLSFALLYAVVIGLYRRNQQRFVLPLVPFVTCAAAYGMRAVWQASARSSVRRIAAVVLMLIALGVPTLANLGYTRMRSNPHTCEQLARWLQANADRTTQRIGLHLLHEVPLAREHANLFDADGAPRPVFARGSATNKT